jgi:hypothetical protein
MPGILDDTPVGVLDPRSMALMQMGLGLMQSSGPSLTPTSLGQSLGQAGMQGMQTFQQANQSNQQQQLFALKMAEVKRTEAERIRKEAAMAQLLKDPRFANMGPLLQVAPQQAIERAFPKDNKPVVVAPGGSLVDPEKPDKPLFTAPREATESDLAKILRERNALPAGDPRIADYDAKIKKLTTHTPGTNVTVTPDNMGLKPIDRFNMEDKLRGDFRAHPVVKASDEMNSAFNLIETAKKNPSPANDLAMATKYMKILDPGSVVRESELALAMGAGGMMDKVQNYANMVMTGKKLTPSQREDFYASAKQINDSFLKERDGVAARFTDNAKQYNLTPDNVVGAPRKAAAVMDKRPPASQHKGRTLIEEGTGKRFKSDGMSWRLIDG